MDKPNAMELLKEARGYVNSMKVEYQHRNEGGYYEEELRRAVDLKDRIDAFLAAPSESAMEMVRKIREGTVCTYATGNGLLHSQSHVLYTISAHDAAALIEGLQRRVPRAMLEDLLDMCFDLGDEYFLKGGKEYAEQVVARILAKHGVEVF